MPIPSPLVALKDYLLSRTAITLLVGREGVIVGPVTETLRSAMPRKLISILSAGIFESSLEYPYWKPRVQINAYGTTPYAAHEISLVLAEELTGATNVVIVQAEGLNARITDIQHEGGPFPLTDDQMADVPMEVTFWGVGAIRAEV